MDIQTMLIASVATIATVVPAAVLIRDGRRGSAPSDSARRALRHTTIASTVATAPLGATLALVAAALVGAVGSSASPRTLVLVPVIALVAYLGILAVGELTLPRPTGPVREASVVRRSAGDVTSAADRNLVWACAATALGTATVLALIASGPRSISRVVGRYESVTATPFPGWSVALPVVVTITVTLLGAGAVTRLVAARPALAGVDGAWDLWLRRRIARQALRGAQLVLGLMIGGLLLVASVGLRELAFGGDGVRAAPESSVHEVAGWALTVLALAIGVLALGIALRPARDPAPEPSPAPTAAVAR
ncbi:MAG: hypothetical protein HGA44_22440 [Cellulomonadaceae bacterium]|nr:hypothetical protein [Cellulomonadaceae bacterium]